MRVYDGEGRIVVADDDEGVRSWLRHALTGAGYSVWLAGSVREARQHLRRLWPNLLIVDLGLPDGDGLELVAELRQSADAARVPALILSGCDDPRLRIAGLDAGANDFLVKPIDRDELLARVRAHLRVARRAEELHHHSCFDAMTGLLNRPGFELHAQAAIEQTWRAQRSLAVAFFDLDGFKQINDRLGHGVGDDALREVAGVLSRSVRMSDLAARWGGDEFVVGLVGADGRTAQRVAERIQRHVSELSVSGLGRRLGVSAGVATLGQRDSPDDVPDVHLLVATADRAMYHDKRRRGRAAAEPRWEAAER
jgi:two-component system cell cycle response regulator